MTIEKILLTHGHIDHCGSAGILAEELGVPIEGPHEDDLFWIARLARGRRTATASPASRSTPDRWLVDGDQVDRRRADLRRPPLPRPHARPCRLPPSRIEAGDGRRRAVQGLGRPLGLPARQPAAADRFDHPAAVADGRRHRFRPRPRADVDLRPRARDQSLTSATPRWPPRQRSAAQTIAQTASATIGERSSRHHPDTSASARASPPSMPMPWAIRARMNDRGDAPQRQPVRRRTARARRAGSGRTAHSR